jgi:hypothetical protein
LAGYGLGNERSKKAPPAEAGEAFVRKLTRSASAALRESGCFQNSLGAARFHAASGIRFSEKIMPKPRIEPHPDSIGMEQAQA